MNSEINKLPVL